MIDVKAIQRQIVLDTYPAEIAQREADLAAAYAAPHSDEDAYHLGMFASETARMREVLAGHIG